METIKLILTLLVLSLFVISGCSNLPETNEQKEVKEEVKPEVKQEVKQDVKEETKPIVQEQTKQEVKEEVKVEETGYKKYKDPVFGIVVEYPVKMEVNTQLDKNEKLAGFVVRFRAPKEDEDDVFQENMVVTREEYTGQLGIEDYSKSRVQILGLMGEVRSDKKIDLGRIPGHEAYYVTTEKINKKDVDFKHKEAWGINNRKLYVVKYSARKEKYKDFEADFDHLVKSFELTK